MLQGRRLPMQPRHLDYKRYTGQIILGLLDLWRPSWTPWRLSNKFLNRQLQHRVETNSHYGFRQPKKEETHSGEANQAYRVVSRATRVHFHPAQGDSSLG